MLGAGLDSWQQDAEQWRDAEETEQSEGDEQYRRRILRQLKQKREAEVLAHVEYVCGLVTPVGTTSGPCE